MTLFTPEDPDIALAEIRHFYQRILAGQDAEDDGLALAEYVRDLDEWLAAGGFLPERWESARRINPKLVEPPF